MLILVKSPKLHLFNFTTCQTPFLRQPKRCWIIMHSSHLASITVKLFFSGLPVCSISRLQYIKNSAARMLTYTERSAHVTPIRFNLCPLTFMKFFCLLLGHTMVLLLLITLTYFFRIFPLDHFDQLEVNFFVFGEFSFHLWEAGLSLLWLLNFGIPYPCLFIWKNIQDFFQKELQIVFSIAFSTCGCINNSILHYSFAFSRMPHFQWKSKVHLQLYFPCLTSYEPVRFKWQY